MFIVIAISCSACDSRSVGLFNNMPTKEQIQAVKDEIGDMYCIRDYLIEIQPEEIKEL